MTEDEIIFYVGVLVFILIGWLVNEDCESSISGLTKRKKEDEAEGIQPL